MVVPAGDAIEAQLFAVAGVYDEYVMRRTLLALAARTRITLPGDIELLIENVYTLPDPEEHAVALATARVRHEEQQTLQNRAARTRALPRPTPPRRSPRQSCATAARTP